MRSLGDRTPYWIGLNDMASEGVFIWADGQPLGYTHWNASEPNNVGEQDYGAINLGHALDASVTRGTWSDTFLNGYTGSSGAANGPYHGIMELPLPSDARFYATNLPFALSVNRLTGAITGTPTTTGTQPITLVLVASNTVSAELHLQVTVTSVLRMSWARYYSSGIFGFQIEANPDVTYAIEYKNNLSDPFWSVATTVTGPTTVGDETGGVRSRFYRLRQISP